jgi:hypothetical protein
MLPGFRPCAYHLQGGVVLPIMLNILIGKVGFAWAVRAFGFLSLAMLAVANAIMTPAKRDAGKSEPSRRRPSVWNILGDAPFILVAVACVFAVGIPAITS